MPQYSDARYGVTQFRALPGDGGTSVLLSPAGTATAAGTTTNTIAGKNIGFGIPVKIKQIVYTIFSAQTGAGDNVTLALFTGTGATAVGSLAITTQIASSVNTSAVINSVIGANVPIRIDAVAVQTASGEKAAYGYLGVTYQEAFDNTDR